MIFKEINYRVQNIFNNIHHNSPTWEEVPDEDLWEDGEVGYDDVLDKIEERVFNTGEWTLIRRVSDDNEHSKD